MAKRKRKAKRSSIDLVRPTDEREAKGRTVNVGMSKRFVPAIDTLHERGYLTRPEWKALRHYRDQASLADRSPVKSCCDDTVGSGNGPGAAITSARIETARIERDLGALRDIARAVAVDDLSLSQWCIKQYGSREEYDNKGRVVAIVPINKSKRVPEARMQLRAAAKIISK